MRNESDRTELLTGWWWRPEFPNDQIPGTAYVMQNGQVRMNLMDSFKEFAVQPENSLYPVSMQVPILIGEGADNRRSFVFDVSYKEMVPNLHPDSDLKRPSRAFALRFIHRAEQKFECVSSIREAYIEIDGLFEWFQNNQIDAIWNEESISVNLPRQTTIDDLQVELEEYKIEFILRHDGRVSHKTVDFKSRAFIRLQSNKGLSRQRFVDLVKLIHAFFSLALNRWMSITDIQVADQIFNSDDSMTWQRTGAFHDASLPFMMSGTSAGNEDPDVLIRLDMIRDDFPALLTKWLVRYEEIGRVYDLYFSVERAPYMTVETQFLSYLRALEGFFRWKHPHSRYVDQVEFEGWIVNNIKPLFEKGYHDNSGKKLTHNTMHLLKTMANRWALPIILKNIIEWRSNDVIQRLLMSISLPECEEDVSQRKVSKAISFADRIAETRNVLSHGLPQSGRTLADATEFIEANKFLRILLQAALLEAAGLEPHRIDSILLSR